MVPATMAVPALPVEQAIAMAANLTAAAFLTPVPVAVPIAEQPAALLLTPAQAVAHPTAVVVADSTAAAVVVTLAVVVVTLAAAGITKLHAHEIEGLRISSSALLLLRFSSACFLS
jgi:hypothetical protein